MRIVFSPQAIDDQEFHGRREREKIQSLIASILKNPFRGIGKPEPLRQEWAGYWSRRITREHHLVYRVMGKHARQTLEVVSCRFHYPER